MPALRGLRTRRFHRQGNAFGFRVGAEHVHLHDLAHLDHIARFLDVAVRQFADVHQPILMNADIDEGSELGHVGDDAFERHARLQVPDLLHVVLKAGREEFVARVASGLAQLFQNVVQSVDAGGEAALVDLLQQRRLASDDSCSMGTFRLLAICSTTG